MERKKLNKHNEGSIGRPLITGVMGGRFLYAQKSPALSVYIDQIYSKRGKNGKYEKNKIDSANF